LGFLGGKDNKESACDAGKPSSIPGFGEIPWRREWLPTLMFLPGESCEGLEKVGNEMKKAKTVMGRTTIYN